MSEHEVKEEVFEVRRSSLLGEQLRQFWLPIAPVSMFRRRHVLLLRVLDEELIFFESLAGEFGLIGGLCAHRPVDMEFGIPEMHGLRCPYHGWEYDLMGKCIGSPFLREDGLDEEIRIPGYPVQVIGGFAFAYLGPLPAPAFPVFDFLAASDLVRKVGVIEAEIPFLEQENEGTFSGKFVDDGQIAANFFASGSDELPTQSGHDFRSVLGGKARYVQELQGSVVQWWRKLRPERPSEFSEYSSSALFPIGASRVTSDKVFERVILRVPINAKKVRQFIFFCERVANDDHSSGSTYVDLEETSGVHGFMNLPVGTRADLGL